MLNRLYEVYKRLNSNSALVAFSGGVDSAVVAYSASKYFDRVIAVTIKSPFEPENEIRSAKEFTNNHNIEHLIIDHNEPDDSIIWSNPSDRCYYCKKGIFLTLHEIASKEGFKIILEGTNSSDLKGHRPGIKALKELNIISPLLEAGLTKSDVRKIASELQLEVADKPAAACLASRIPYGEKITPHNLTLVGKAEELIRELGFQGLLRVRWNNGDIAKIEVDKNNIKSFVELAENYHLAEKLKEIGFSKIYLDLSGYSPMVPKK